MPDSKLLYYSSVLRAAGRAFNKAGFMGAFGHVSVRLNPAQYLVGPAISPGSFRTEDCTLISLKEDFPSEVVLGEVRAHHQIYMRRPEVGGICRFYSESLLALSVAGFLPAARDAFSAFFYPEPPFWNDTRLLRDDHLAGAVADTLGKARAIILRGNGAIAVGQSMAEALNFAWMLDQAARSELKLLSSTIAWGSSLQLSKSQAEALAVLSEREVLRLWNFLTDGDAEAPRTGPPSGLLSI